MGVSESGPAFLILASPKSGTTWLQLMLSAHPEAHCVESRAWGGRFIAQSAEWFHMNMDRYAAFLAPLLRLPGGEQEADAAGLTAAMHGALLGWVRERTGKRLVGEKSTPYEGDSVRTVEAHHSETPGLAFVHLVRDPRDVVVSAFVHHTRAHPPADAVERARYERCVREGRVPGESIERWAGNWRDVAAGAERARGLFGRFIEVRYEDLVARPIEEMRRVLGHVGVADDEETARGCVEAASFERLSGRARGEEDRGSFFRKGEPGDWVNWLSDDEAARVMELAGDGARERYGVAAL